MTLPSCRGSGKSAKKLRKTKASLRAPRLEEGSCNVIATLRHDQSATDRITPNQATGRLEVRPESPCRIIPDRSITFLHANHYDDSELQPFVTNSFARLPCRCVDAPWHAERPFRNLAVRSTSTRNYARLIAGTGIASAGTSSAIGPRRALRPPSNRFACARSMATVQRATTSVATILLVRFAAARI